MVIFKKGKGLVDRLDYLNAEIEKLQKEKSEICKKMEGDGIKFFSSFDWAKECIGRFYYDTFGAAGIPKYRISITTPSNIKIPYFPSPVKVMGDHIHYENNMMFSSNNKYSYIDIRDYFYTSSDEMMEEFLRVVKFKELIYDKNLYRVLTAVSANRVE